MGLLGRLGEKLRSMRGEKVGAVNPSSPITVPADHHVTLHPPARLPELGSAHGDALIVHLGSASDEFEAELDALMKPLRLALARSAEREPGRLVLLAPTATRVSDLFRPNDPEVAALPGLVIWTIDAGSAALWRARPERLEAALAQVAGFRIRDAPLHQVAFLNIELRAQRDGGRAGGTSSPRPPSGTRFLVGLLQRAGVEVRQVPSDGQFLVEVCRPDAVLIAFRGEVVQDLRDADAGAGRSPIDEAESEQSGCIVSRAPRLHRLLRSALEQPASEPPAELLAELRVRSIPLLVLSDRDGQVFWRSWPEHDVAVAVYPDLETLVRAASELGLAPGSFGVSEVGVRDLVAWCSTRDDAGVAFCTYDRDEPRHVFVAGEVLRAGLRNETPTELH